MDQAILKQWQEWNHQGFIPGSNETEEAFLERIAFCQSLEQNLEKIVGANLPFKGGDPQSKEILENALPLTQELYGIEPRWVPLFFSNYQLSPWHGGCAWIFQLNDQTPTAAFLQLRARFRDSIHFLGIYRRQELIAHELAHVGRMLYQEPQFEEMLAYQSSSSPWRRWWGPIVQSSKESFFFIILLGIAILTDFASLSMGLKMGAIVWGIKLLPFIFLAVLLGRLIYRQQIFKRCLACLQTIYPSREAKHLLYRLRDEEIRQLSRCSSSELQKFIVIASSQSFRWQFLMTLYPFPSS